MMRSGLGIDTTANVARQATVLFLDGIVTGEAAQALSEAVANAIENECPNVVINMERVAYIDSEGIGLLFHLGRQVEQEASGKMVLAALSPAVRSILTNTRVDLIYPFYESIEEAMGSL